MAVSEKLSIRNRKFLGSKHRLLDFLTEVILSATSSVGTFIDGFSGTGVVASHFRRYAGYVITNDLLYSNFVVNRAFLTSTPLNTDPGKIGALIQSLNALEPVSDYAYSSYGGTYFSHENAGLIDAIRDRIEAFRTDEVCTEQEYYVLLTSLLYAVDKVGNTVGQYDAFLKHLGEASYDERGRHRIDSNVYKRLILKEPDLEDTPTSICQVFNEDLNQLIRRIEGDVLYLDPPYNNRQYVDCYHVLENIARWDKPPLLGKTKKFERAHLKSLYSQKRNCREALSDLIENARAKHIFLSYNSEGILPHETLLCILGRRGPVEVHTKAYPVFGNGAGCSVKRLVEERIYHC